MLHSLIQKTEIEQQILTKKNEIERFTPQIRKEGLYYLLLSIPAVKMLIDIFIFDVTPHWIKTSKSEGVNKSE